MASTPPSGPMQIGEGDVGVFLSRSDAIAFAVALQETVHVVEGDGKFSYEANVIHQLIDLLRTAQQKDSEHRRALQKVPPTIPPEG
jgi:hypothetical protein